MEITKNLQWMAKIVRKRIIFFLMIFTGVFKQQYFRRKKVIKVSQALKDGSQTQVRGHLQAPGPWWVRKSGTNQCL